MHAPHATYTPPTTGTATIYHTHSTPLRAYGRPRCSPPADRRAAALETAARFPPARGTSDEARVRRGPGRRPARVRAPRGKAREHRARAAPADGGGAKERARRGAGRGSARVLVHAVRGGRARGEIGARTLLEPLRSGAQGRHELSTAAKPTDDLREGGRGARGLAGLCARLAPTRSHAKRSRAAPLRFTSRSLAPTLRRTPRERSKRRRARMPGKDRDRAARRAGAHRDSRRGRVPPPPRPHSSPSSRARGRPNRAKGRSRGRRERFVAPGPRPDPCRRRPQNGVRKMDMASAFRHTTSRQKAPPPAGIHQGGTSGRKRVPVDIITIYGTGSAGGMDEAADRNFRGRIDVSFDIS